MGRDRARRGLPPRGAAGVTRRLIAGYLILTVVVLAVILFGITTATEWSSARVGDVSDYARSHVNGDDLASRAFRGVVTGAESMTRFQLGVTGGLAPDWGPVPRALVAATRNA